MEKKRITLPLIVEGKYDKITLSSIFECKVFTTEGFGIFNSSERQALLRRVAGDGIIVLLDPDGGGSQIRSFISSIIPKDKVYNLYVPRIEGKERRKTKASRSGTLGVEGMAREVLERVLAPFTESGGRVEKNAQNSSEMITILNLFEDGLTGREASCARRARLAEYFELPPDMTAKALVEALNIVTDREGYLEAVRELFFT